MKQDPHPTTHTHIYVFLCLFTCFLLLLWAYANTHIHTAQYREDRHSSVLLRSQTGLTTSVSVGLRAGLLINTMLTRIYLLRGQTKPATLVSVSPVSIPPLFMELLDVDVKNVCVLLFSMESIILLLQMAHIKYKRLLLA